MHRTSPYLTKGQLEERLQLHRNTVTRLLAAGHFPNAFLVNRQWRIPVSDVDAFVRSSPRHADSTRRGR